MGNQSMSQSCCARTFTFPVGLKKREACQSPECNQELLCCSGSSDSDFPLRHLHAAADEKNTRKLVNPHPPAAARVTLIRFVNHIHLEWEAEEVASAASSEEHKGGQLIGPSVWGKGTLHNANCTSAAISFSC